MHISQYQHPKKRDGSIWWYANIHWLFRFTEISFQARQEKSVDLYTSSWIAYPTFQKHIRKQSYFSGTNKFT